MSNKPSSPSSPLPDLYLKDFPEEIQDHGKVELGGGFSSLPKPPVSKIRQSVKESDPDIIKKT
jgi:hypothetical protein